MSGSTDSRPELNRLMADAKRRQVRCGARLEAGPLWAFTAPSGERARGFESLGIAFVSLSDNLDLSTASGRLMFHIIGAMAEFERELIQERVKAGIRNATG